MARSHASKLTSVARVEATDDRDDRDAELDESCRRRSERRKLYLEESVNIIFATSEGILTGKCLDISSSGLSFGTEGSPFVSPKQGLAASVTVKTYNGASLPIRARVVSARASQNAKTGKQTVAVEFLASHHDDESIATARGAPLIVVPSFFAPLATAPENLASSGVHIFRILGFSSAGALLMSEPNGPALLLPGFRLHLSVMLPNSGERLLQAEILRVRTENAAQGSLVDVSFPELSPNDRAFISEFLLMANRDCSVTALRHAGFFVEGAQKSFRIAYCQTRKEWDDVLALRLQAYQAVGKFMDRPSSSAMADGFDSFARQIVCKYGQDIVGSVRIVFVQKERERSEHIALGIDVPPWLFEKPFVEVSRACTHAEYRGSDVLPLLFQKCFEVAVQTGNNHILANCNSDLWPLYERIGFKKIGVRFTAFGRDDCELILLDASELLLGLRTDFLTWNQFFLKAARHIQNNPSAAVSRTQKLLSRGTTAVHGFLEPKILSLRRRLKHRKKE